MRISDWSSDVCSSDLEAQPIGFARKHRNLAERLQSGGIRIEAKQRELAVRGIGAVARDDQNPPLTADRDIATQIDIVDPPRSEEHTSELQSLMRISYAVFCLKKKTTTNKGNSTQQTQQYQQNEE